MLATTTAPLAPTAHLSAEERLLLDASIRGRVVAPADESWDEARRAWNLAVDQQPLLVVLAECAEDIVEVVRFAHDRGLRVAPQSTGHNAHGLENELAGTILLKTSSMRGVEIDPERQIARVQAGAQWQDVTGPAAAHGLAALAGSSPDVGVVGYTLGGGFSWLSRRYGLAANRVTAIEVVTGSGELVRADHEHHAELFWALRGGGGSFGVVTAMEFALIAITEVYAGALFFPQERAREVLNAWRGLTQRDDLPDELTTVGRLLNVPPFPDVPESLRGRSFVVVEGIFIGEEAEGSELIAPLRALGPEIDTFAMVPAPALSHLHMDPEGPVPGKGDGMVLDTIPAQAIDALIAAAGPGTGTPLISAELRHAGGALARTATGHGALDRLGGEYLMFAVGPAPTPELRDAVEAGVSGVKRALAPWESRHAYLNFAERAVDPRRLYGSEAAFRRLQAVKEACDPANTFQSNHPIPAAR